MKCRLLTLDLGGSNPIIRLCTSSHNGDYLSQEISKEKIYAAVKCYGTDTNWHF
jgi:hypothetical protein